MKRLLAALGCFVLVLACTTSTAQGQVVAYQAYSPVTPYGVYGPPVPYAAYYAPAPVMVYRPYPAYVPAPVYYGPGAVVVRPKVYVRGQPVRNVLRAVTP